VCARARACVCVCVLGLSLHIPLPEAFPRKNPIRQNTANRYTPSHPHTTQHYITQPRTRDASASALACALQHRSRRASRVSLPNPALIRGHWVRGAARWRQVGQGCWWGWGWRGWWEPSADCLSGPEDARSSELQTETAVEFLSRSLASVEMAVEILEVLGSVGSSWAFGRLVVWGFALPIRGSSRNVDPWVSRSAHLPFAVSLSRSADPP
jgi:hypothetical protein